MHFTIFFRKIIYCIFFFQLFNEFSSLNLILFHLNVDQTFLSKYLHCEPLFSAFKVKIKTKISQQLSQEISENARPQSNQPHSCKGKIFQSVTDSVRLSELFTSQSTSEKTDKTFEIIENTSFQVHQKVCQKRQCI